MDEAQLRRRVESGVGILAIASEFRCSPTTVKYWVHRFGIVFRNKNFRDRAPVLHRCQCGETDPEKFYGRKKCVCGKCHNRDVLQRGQQKRLRMLSFLGGVCSSCGYCEHTAALDLHHRDPSRKDPNFISKRGWSWTRIEEELKDCVILCKNCHAALHAGQLILRGVG